MPTHNSQDFCCQWPYLRSRPLLTQASARDLQTLTGRSGSVSVGFLLLSSGSWYAQAFVCAPYKILFSPDLWKFCNQILLSFKVRFTRDSQSLCQKPRLGSLMWSLEPLQQCKNFFGIIFLQSVACPPGGYGL